MWWNAIKHIHPCPEHNLFNVILNQHEHAWIGDATQLAGQIICEQLDRILGSSAMQNILDVMQNLHISFSDRGCLLLLFPPLGTLCSSRSCSGGRILRSRRLRGRSLRSRRLRSRSMRGRILRSRRLRGRSLISRILRSRRLRGRSLRSRRLRSRSLRSRILRSRRLRSRSLRSRRLSRRLRGRSLRSRRLRGRSVVNIQENNLYISEKGLVPEQCPEGLLM